jgi:hypothetical protein
VDIESKLRLPRFGGHPDYAAPTAAKQRSSYSTGLTRPTVEFTVGDATLDFAPDEVAGIVGKLVNGSVGD